MSDPGFMVRTGSPGRCPTLGLWFEQVGSGRMGPHGLGSNRWFEQQGRCRTLGLWFERWAPWVYGLVVGFVSSWSDVAVGTKPLRYDIQGSCVDRGCPMAVTSTAASSSFF